ncbi:MAG: hypothetical protein EOM55_01055 [Clostridia bacterium]|nr:hypothetical protein [Clostridia bacterium]
MAGIKEQNAKQLISYMRQLKLTFGLLFGNTLQLYYDKIDNNKPPTNICELRLNEDNNLGIELMKQLYKDNFSKKNFDDFCCKQLESKTREKEFVEKQDFLCSFNCIKHVRELLLIEYPEEVVNEIDINISRKKETIKINNGGIKKSTFFIYENKSFIREENESIQEWIKRVLIFLMKNNLLTEDEIERLHNKEYSKKAFGIQFPLLCDNKKDTIIAGNTRYWTRWTLGQEFVCSQWWRDKEDLYEELINNWINSITK